MSLYRADAPRRRVFRFSVSLAEQLVVKPIHRVLQFFVGEISSFGDLLAYLGNPLILTFDQRLLRIQ